MVFSALLTNSPISPRWVEFDGGGNDALCERFKNIAGLLRARGMETQSYSVCCSSIEKRTGLASDV